MNSELRIKLEEVKGQTSGTSEWDHWDLFGFALLRLRCCPWHQHSSGKDDRTNYSRVETGSFSHLPSFQIVRFGPTSELRLGVPALAGEDGEL